MKSKAPPIILRENAPISRFSIRSVLNASNSETVTPDCVSTFNYYCNTDSSFVVCDDQETVLAIHLNSDYNVIIKENVRCQSTPIASFDHNRHHVFSLLADFELDMLLAVEDSHQRGKVVQYSLSTRQVVREYRDIGINRVFTLCRFGRLCVLGGGNSGVRALDLVSRRLIGNGFSTAVYHILSMQMCAVDFNGLKMLLIVSGRRRIYSDMQTDVFDVTKLFEKFGLDVGNLV